MLTAINCGDDTDCTAATVGATLGILRGMDCIPEDWMAHIGDEIITVSVNRCDVLASRAPKTCSELTQRVIDIAPAVLHYCSKMHFAKPVALSDSSDIPDDIAEQMAQTLYNGTCKSLEHLKPFTVEFEDAFIKVALTLSAAPEIKPDGRIGVHISFTNNRTFENMQHPLSLRWILPDGFSAEGKSNALLYAFDKHGTGSAALDVTIIAGQIVQPQNRIVLEITTPGRHTAMYASFVLLGC
jgi:hypothetical protein